MSPYKNVAILGVSLIRQTPLSRLSIQLIRYRYRLVVTSVKL